MPWAPIGPWLSTLTYCPTALLPHAAHSRRCPPENVLSGCPMDTSPNDAFFDTLPVFEEFEGVADAAKYRPLPDSWWLATADIVGSTQAIAAGRYKAVNMAGASVISAVLNAIGSRELPFVFGGDGALVAVPASALDATRRALAACRTW